MNETCIFVYVPGRKVELISGKGVNKRTDTAIRNNALTIQKGGNRFNCPSVRTFGPEIIRALNVLGAFPGWSLAGGVEEFELSLPRIRFIRSLSF